MTDLLLITAFGSVLFGLVVGYLLGSQDATDARAAGEEGRGR